MDSTTSTTATPTTCMGGIFLGGADGRNVLFNQKEETRIYARLRPRYEGETRADVSKRQQAEFRLYELAKTRYTTERAKAEARYQADVHWAQQDEVNVARLRKGLGVRVLDSTLLHPPRGTRPSCDWRASTTTTCGAAFPISIRSLAATGRTPES